MSDRPDSSTGPQQTETTHSGSTSTFTAVGGGGPRVLNADGEPLHSGDDDRIDCVTGLVTGLEEMVEELDGTGEIADGLRDALEECQKLDALLIATIQHERESAAQLADLRGERDRVKADAEDSWKLLKVVCEENYANWRKAEIELAVLRGERDQLRLELREARELYEANHG